MAATLLETVPAPSDPRNLLIMWKMTDFRLLHCRTCLETSNENGLSDCSSYGILRNDNPNSNPQRAHKAHDGNVSYHPDHFRLGRNQFHADAEEDRALVEGDCDE